MGVAGIRSLVLRKVKVFARARRIQRIRKKKRAALDMMAMLVEDFEYHIDKCEGQYVKGALYEGKMVDSQEYDEQLKGNKLYEKQ